MIKVEKILNLFTGELVSGTNVEVMSNIYEDYDYIKIKT
jgi:hypothetical protein